MTGPRFVKPLWIGLAVCCGVVALSGAAAYVAVEQTRQKLLDDKALLGDAGAIFPIGHFVVRDAPGRIYQDRLDAAMRLWQERPRPIWLLAGGGSGTRESGAEVGKRYLVGKGIPPASILTLDELPAPRTSLDTTEEIGIAANIATARGVPAVAVIGEVLHLAQAGLVFDSYGIRTIFEKTPEADYGLRYRVTRTGALLITLVDRRGVSLFWLRWIRSGDRPNWPWSEF